jgi:hypothetical protein
MSDYLTLGGSTLHNVLQVDGVMRAGPITPLACDPLRDVVSTVYLGAISVSFDGVDRIISTTFGSRHRSALYCKRRTERRHLTRKVVELEFRFSAACQEVRSRYT